MANLFQLARVRISTFQHRNYRLSFLKEKNMARPLIYPGKILANELDELQMSTSELARILHVPTNRITEIINGQRGITADTALRLGRWFGTGAELWINLQKNYELRLAEQKKGEEIEATISPRILLSEDKQVTVLC
jgi:addiction module HigA family antidote